MWAPSTTVFQSTDFPLTGCLIFATSLWLSCVKIPEKTIPSGPNKHATTKAIGIIKQRWHFAAILIFDLNINWRSWSASLWYILDFAPSWYYCIRGIGNGHLIPPVSFHYLSWWTFSHIIPGVQHAACTNIIRISVYGQWRWLEPMLVETTHHGCHDSTIEIWLFSKLWKGGCL